MRPGNPDLGAVPFEALLRARLGDLRPVEGAPDVLRSRVESVPERLGRQHPVRRLLGGHAGTLIVAGLAAAASLVLLAVAIRPGLIAPGPGGVAPTATFDPTVEGPGLLYGVVPTLVIVVGLVALVAVGLATGWIIRHSGIGGWTGAIRLAALGTLAVAAMAVALHPGFTWGDGVFGSVAGYSVQAEPPEGGDGAPVFYEAANPGDPLVVVVTVTNPGPLPIRLDGLVEDPMAPQTITTRWTAVATATDPGTDPNRLDQLQSFRPIVVEAGGKVNVYLVAKAGKCTFGPDFVEGSPGVGGYVSRGRDIRLAYSVFGLSSSAPFELPMHLVEPTREGCA